jgi:hypothetical protein
MKISRRFVRSLCLCTVLLLTAACATLPARAQAAPDRVGPVIPGTTSAAGNATPFGNNSPDIDQARMMHNMLKQRNSARQKEIVDDTNRLLDLAKQLKEAVDKTGQNELSINVVNTASEMEKLAKSVKEKMRDGQ